MKTHPVLFLGLLLPAYAVAGAQYTAEDVIRYFEQANATAVTADPAVAPPAKWPDRSIVIGGPSAAAPESIVIGAPAGDGPLIIPMTGAKAGYTMPPVRTPVRPAGYDLLVTFELESARLTSQARENLEAFARALRNPALAGLRFAVEGHTDSSGSPEYNLKLSKARAASVVAYLVGHGIAPDRLKSAGFGETRPRLTDPWHPDNRRVETRRIE
ncbi:MAG TPA: OmpA family protein [Paracoccaceae bacterium]|nr:OmpA family protein [Paracoccaceae bacterium]